MAIDLPRAPGVYQIRCTPTGKVYVGSAVNLAGRWKIHLRALRKGDHPNPRLQEAWNDYGEENFKCTVLELVDHDDLLAAEQRWIDQTRCVESSVGFNRLNRAVAPGQSHGLVWEGFIDPDGNEVIITNLHEFCRRHRLSASAMAALADPKHKLKQHRGWTHRDKPRKRAYIKTWDGFIDPDGKEIAPITNLKAFCRQHGLDATHMVAVVKGRICSHRGWTHRDGRTPQSEKTYYGFVDPEGQRVVINNLPAFCAANSLKKVRMYNLISGVRKRHKGWTWRPDDGYEAQ